MIKYSNGKYIDMSDAEIEELEKQSNFGQNALPNAEQRIEALESAMLELIMGGGNGD